MTKRAKISIGLCQAHRARRRNFGLAAFALMLAGIGALLGAVAAEEGSYLGLLSGVSLFAAVMLALFGTRVLYPDRIDRDQARLKGCGEVFLASLPSEPYY